MSGRKNPFKPATIPILQRKAQPSGAHLDERLKPLVRSLCFLAACAGIVMGAYLCLRTDSNLRSISFIPAAVARWSDQHGEIRNIPAFALLAIPFLILTQKSRARYWTMASLAVFAATTELAQYFIPTRWCQWQDIAAAWAGLLITWSVFGAIEFLRRTVKRGRQAHDMVADSYAAQSWRRVSAPETD